MLEKVTNPLRIKHTESSVATTWTIETDDRFPFKGQALAIDSAIPLGRIRNSSNSIVFPSPAADIRKGVNFDQFQLTWDQPVRGTVQVVVRMD